MDVLLIYLNGSISAYSGMTIIRLSIFLLMIGSVIWLAACQSTLQTSMSDPPTSASRKFVGPNEFPPREYAGYGILAFPHKPVEKRARLFCDAYVRTLLSSTYLDRAGLPISQQMVTVWPMTSAKSAEEIDENAVQLGGDSEIKSICDIAVPGYDLASGLGAIRDAMRAERRGVGAGRLTGRGPFLLAWAPGRTKGADDTLVLVSDLSSVVSREQAFQEFLRWRDEIQLRQQLWSRGWTPERLRVLLQRWSDQRSKALLSVIGLEI